MKMIQANNRSAQSGRIIKSITEYLLTTGRFLSMSEDIGNIVVGIDGGLPVYLHLAMRFFGLTSYS